MDANGRHNNEKNVTVLMKYQNNVCPYKHAHMICTKIQYAHENAPEYRLLDYADYGTLHSLH
jgi:hypothetical protein